MLTPDERGCIVGGCLAPHHAQGYCGAHYRAWERSGEEPTPEARAKRHREEGIDCELRYGVVSQLYSPTGSMFDNDEDRREAWEAAKDKLLKEYTDKGNPGHRPWAWWHFEAGRPQHLTAYPDSSEFAERVDRRRSVVTEKGAIAEGRALDSYNFEPIIFLAANGHLLDHELETIRERAREAESRINTDREQMTSPAISPDRSRVRLARAVEEALGGESYGPDYGIPYTKE
jgi:hypothetical protein